MNIRNILRFVFNSVNVEDVFTPTSVARLTFISRNEIEDNFDRNFKQRGRNIIVFGQSGSGKTTFLNRYFEKNKIKPLIIQCDSNMTFQNMIDQIFDQLNPYYKSSSSHTVGFKTKSGYSLKAGFQENESQIETSSNSTNNYDRMLHPVLSVNRLSVLLGNLLNFRK